MFNTPVTAHILGGAVIGNSPETGVIDAYHRVFGDDAEQIPVTALKSYFGHCDAGSGAVELAGSVLALRNGELPMTLNYEIPDPRCRINVVHDEPLRLRTRSALSVNRTNVGQSAAVVVRAV